MGESNKNVVFNWRPRFREALPSMDLQERIEKEKLEIKAQLAIFFITDHIDDIFVKLAKKIYEEVTVSYKSYNESVEKKHRLRKKKYFIDTLRWDYVKPSYRYKKPDLHCYYDWVNGSNFNCDEKGPIECATIIAFEIENIEMLIFSSRTSERKVDLMKMIYFLKACKYGSDYIEENFLDNIKTMRNYVSHPEQREEESTLPKNKLIEYLEEYPKWFKIKDHKLLCVSYCLKKLMKHTEVTVLDENLRPLKEAEAIEKFNLKKVADEKVIEIKKESNEIEESEAMTNMFEEKQRRTLIFQIYFCLLRSHIDKVYKTVMNEIAKKLSSPYKTNDGRVIVEGIDEETDENNKTLTQIGEKKYPIHLVENFISKEYLQNFRKLKKLKNMKGKTVDVFCEVFESIDPVSDLSRQIRSLIVLEATKKFYTSSYSLRNLLEQVEKIEKFYDGVFMIFYNDVLICDHFNDFQNETKNYFCNIKDYTESTALLKYCLKKANRLTAENIDVYIYKDTKDTAN